MIRACITIESTKRANDCQGSPRTIRLLAMSLVAGVMTAFPSLARAEIGWHRDYQGARAASVSTGKPVFALFVATWDDEPSAEVFANAEVEAVIAACFEPVRIDVDKDAALIRELAIERVPSVAVISTRTDAITRFDCPKTPAEFVATAARAAQTSAASPRSDTALADASTPSPFGGSLEATPAGVDSSVANKVRQLSNFAEGKATSVPHDNRFQDNRFQVAQQPAQVPAQPAYANTQSAFSQQPYPQQPSPQLAYGQAVPPAAQPVDPSLPRTPPATWSPEQPAPSSYGRFQPTPAPAQGSPYVAQTPYPTTTYGVNPPAATPVPSIEPAASAANPWLAGTATPPADAEPEASATASDAGVESKTASNGFMAGVQKAMNPMNWWSNKSTVAPPPKMPPVRPQPPAGLAATQPSSVVPPSTASLTPPTDPYGSMPVGLDGYCPVTVAQRGAWVEGRAQWGVRHRGRTYLFAGPEQQQAFLANPDRYAPALSGDDPVLAFEAGRSEPGQRSYGVVYQSRMYLFSSPQNRDAFSADPARYTTRVQIAEGLAPSDAARRF